MLLIHTWHIIMQTHMWFAVMIYICGSTEFSQVIIQSIELCYLHAIICFLDTLMPLVNENQMLSCLQIGKMSTFALTI